MSKNSIRFVLVSFLIQSILFSNLIYAEQLSLPAADVSAPEVEHEPISGPLPTGAAHQIKATVKDNVGVDGVSLFYRRLGESQYQRKAMLREAQDSDIFSITLGAKVLSAPGIEYYIQATDTTGNSVLFGYSFEPIKLSVASGTISTVDAGKDATANKVPKTNGTESKKKAGHKWLWIAVGVLVVGAVAAAASGGGGGGGGSGGDSGTVTVSGPGPQ